jgi:hypothetical protein
VESVNKAVEVAVFVIASAVVMGVSYGMALLGNPSSLWLWRDILNLM